ncbi:hypothetical protein RM780_10465 [Streptomyces sp. DSM 44917]|uniref:Addiction module toxin RelE n=1 Tax=Streptomyces boetiae TaxID=3075541 RepID=A0ABU2L737_9ACTN|nr:hypothetical protein [Streptomyces sp. DSM 44917]MDT0307385.1 hypothetical protein [Streptomyces sp. DSM 44917]
MRYELRYVQVAEEQLRALPPTARKAVDKELSKIRDDPYRGAKKGAHGTFWRDFPAGQILYMISDHIITVTVLRITAL